jgi:hypothetical protein
MDVVFQEQRIGHNKKKSAQKSVHQQLEMEHGFGRVAFQTDHGEKNEQKKTGLAFDQLLIRFEPFLSDQSAKKKAEHKGSEKKSNFFVEIAMNGLEAKNESDLHGQTGKTHNSQRKQIEVYVSLLSHSQKHKRTNKEDQREIEEPEGREVREKGEEFGFRWENRFGPEDRVKEITDRCQIEVQSFVSCMKDLFQVLLSDGAEAVKEEFRADKPVFEIKRTNCRAQFFCVEWSEVGGGEKNVCISGNDSAVHR